MPESTDNARIPEPSLVSVPAPLMTPLNVWLESDPKINADALEMAPAYVPFPSNPVEPKESVPFTTFIPPVNVLAPNRRSVVPAPSFISPPVLEMMPLIVVFPE